MTVTEITMCELRLGSYIVIMLYNLYINILSVNFCSVESARQHICQNNLHLVLTRYSVFSK